MLNLYKNFKFWTKIINFTLILRILILKCQIKTPNVLLKLQILNFILKFQILNKNSNYSITILNFQLY